MSDISEKLVRVRRWTDVETESERVGKARERGGFQRGYVSRMPAR